MEYRSLRQLLNSWKEIPAYLVSITLQIWAWISLNVFGTEIPEPPERFVNWFSSHNLLQALEFMSDVYFTYGIFRFQNKHYILDPKLSLKISQNVGKGASDFLQHSVLKPSFINLKPRIPDIRRVLNPIFHRSKIEGKADAIHEIAQRVISKMSESDIINISDLAIKTAFDVFGLAMLGIELGSLDGKQDRFLHAMNTILRRCHALGEVSPHSQEFADNKELLSQETEAIMNKCLEHSTEEKNLVHLLYTAGSFQETKSNLSLLMVAGAGTTSDALTITLYLLAQRPELQQELQKEADEFIGRLRTDASHVPPKLESAMKEVLRIYAISPFNFRQNEAELKLGKITIPAKSDLRPFMWGIHKSKHLWDNSKSFCPGRFLKSSTTNSKWFPFGAGPRICIGQHLAWVELRLLLTHFLHHFNFRRVAETRDLETCVDWVHAVMKTRSDVLLGVQKRQHMEN